MPTPRLCRGSPSLALSGVMAVVFFAVGQLLVSA
jgi:hypothetical protein